MVDMEARHLDEADDRRNVIPWLDGTIRDENFIIGVAEQGDEVYVQFEGHIVSIDVYDLVGDAYGEAFGVNPDRYDFEEDE